MIFCSVVILSWQNVLIVTVVVSTQLFPPITLSFPYYLLIFCNYYLLIGEQNFTSCFT